MNGSLADNADRLTADALHLAMSLDSFATLDWAERIGLALHQSTCQLEDLERRRELLTVSRADDAIIDWLFEAIHDRMQFLEGLYRVNVLN